LWLTILEFRVVTAQQDAFFKYDYLSTFLNLYLRKSFVEAAP